MSDIELKIRKMKTGETLIACFESEADALVWLKSRPSFVDVLGTADPTIDPERSERLRQAMRPTDNEERAYLEEQERRHLEELRADEAASQERAERQREEHRLAMESLGPNEPMAIKWTREGGIAKADPDDQREITDAARRAVELWIKERKTWVSKPKVMSEAMVTVWPGKVPSGAESDRVQQGGTFQTIYLED